MQTSQSSFFQKKLYILKKPHKKHKIDANKMLNAGLFLKSAVRCPQLLTSQENFSKGNFVTRKKLPQSIKNKNGGEIPKNIITPKQVLGNR